MSTEALSLWGPSRKKGKKKWKRQPGRPPDYLITLQRTEEISSLSGKDLLTDFGRFFRGKNFLSYESQSLNNFTSVIERALYIKDFNFFRSNIYSVNEYGKGKVWLSFKDHTRCTFRALIIEEINYCGRYMKRFEKVSKSTQQQQSLEINFEYLPIASLQITKRYVFEILITQKMNYPGRYVYN